jgi:hypothetical protein
MKEEVTQTRLPTPMRATIAKAYQFVITPPVFGG